MEADRTPLSPLQQQEELRQALESMCEDFAFPILIAWLESGDQPLARRYRFIAQLGVTHTELEDI